MNERCGCRCHQDAIGDVKSAEHSGSLFTTLLAQNRAEHLSVRAPEGPRLDDELAAFFACRGCQKLHVGVLSGRPEAQPRDISEKADWNPDWGKKPFDYGAKE